MTGDGPFVFGSSGISRENSSTGNISIFCKFEIPKFERAPKFQNVSDKNHYQ